MEVEFIFGIRNIKHAIALVIANVCIVVMAHDFNHDLLVVVTDDLEVAGVKL